MNERDLLIAIYQTFNRRDIDAVLWAMHPDVDWPNGMEGGRVYGHAGVRDYWTRQWNLIDPLVEPQHFSVDDQGRIVVDVHQVVRDRTGKVLVEQMIQHIYTFQDNLIRSMEIANHE
ncbi:nuclear transport factor 2 family protein [soil metagenome]